MKLILEEPEGEACMTLRKKRSWSRDSEGNGPAKVVEFLFVWSMSDRWFLDFSRIKSMRTKSILAVVAFFPNISCHKANSYHLNMKRMTRIERLRVGWERSNMHFNLIQVFSPFLSGIWSIISVCDRLRVVCFIFRFITRNDYSRGSFQCSYKMSINNQFWTIPILYSSLKHSLIYKCQYLKHQQ